MSTGLDRTFEPYPDVQEPRWLDDSTLLVSAEDRGNVHLHRVDASGLIPPTAIWAGEGCVTGFAEAAGTIAFTLSTPTRPGELLTPAGLDPSESYPALVNVQGGPFGQYGNRFFDEFQMQAATGV